MRAIAFDFHRQKIIWASAVTPRWTAMRKSSLNQQKGNNLYAPLPPC
jgi:hypothetical protein